MPLDNLASLFVTWFSRIWAFIQSLAIYTKRKPDLPVSVSNPAELEKGLYTIPRKNPLGRNGQRRGRVQGDAVLLKPTTPDLPSSAHGTQGLRLNVGPQQQIPESRSNQFLRHPSLRISTSFRRNKRSRESTERRRQRRIAQVPEFTPPPDIHIEDWSSTSNRSREGPAPPYSSGGNSSEPGTLNPTSQSVPCLIITPSTPSEEYIGVDPRMSAALAVVPSQPSPVAPTISTNRMSSSHHDRPSDAPPSSSLPDSTNPRPSPSHNTNNNNETTTTTTTPSATDDPLPECAQTARISIHTSDDDEVTPPHLPDKSSFTFSESLTGIAFGPRHSQDAATTTTLHSPDLRHMSRTPLTLSILDSSFNPNSNSTLLHYDGDDGDDDDDDDDDAGNDDDDPEQRHSMILDATSSGSSSSTTPGHSQQQQRKSRLPYPDVFNFDMYAADLRASMAVFGISTGSPGDSSSSMMTSVGRTSVPQQHIPNTTPLGSLPQTPKVLLQSTPSPMMTVRPPTLSKFQFTIPLTPPQMGSGDDRLLGLGLEQQHKQQQQQGSGIQAGNTLEDDSAHIPPLSGPVQVQRRGVQDLELSMGSLLAGREYSALSGHFRFPLPTTALPQATTATITTTTTATATAAPAPLGASSEVLLFSTSASESAVFDKSFIRQWRSEAGGVVGAVWKDVATGRYRDRYRNQAYSRSPPSLVVERFSAVPVRHSSILAASVLEYGLRVPEEEEEDGLSGPAVREEGGDSGDGGGGKLVGVLRGAVVGNETLALLEATGTTSTSRRRGKKKKQKKAQREVEVKQAESDNDAEETVDEFPNATQGPDERTPLALVSSNAPKTRLLRDSDEPRPSAKFKASIADGISSGGRGEAAAADVPVTPLVRRVTRKKGDTAIRGRDSENMNAGQGSIAARPGVTLSTSLKRSNTTVRSRLRGVSRRGGAVGGAVSGAKGPGRSVSLLREVTRQEEEQKVGGAFSIGDSTLGSVYSGEGFVLRR